MSAEYGTFRCRICGREGFAPMPDRDDIVGDGAQVELTCANAHTDLYDAAAIERIAPTNASGKVLSREAYAGAV